MERRSRSSRSGSMAAAEPWALACAWVVLGLVPGRSTNAKASRRRTATSVKSFRNSST